MGQSWGIGLASRFANVKLNKPQKRLSGWWTVRMHSACGRLLPRNTPRNPLRPDSGPLLLPRSCLPCRQKVGEALPGDARARPSDSPRDGGEGQERHGGGL